MNFSIIIPLYNKDYYIKKCIDSVLDQTYSLFEIIIVNDGSTDDSLSVVTRTYKKEIEDGKIKLINQPNKGVSEARNKGVSLSSYEYICFLDADDEWKKWFLESIVCLINDYPLAEWYSLQHEVQIEGHKPINNSSYFKKGFRGYVSNFYLASLFGSISNSSKVCIKKDSLLKIGGFPVKFRSAEDLYVWLELARSCQIAFENTVSVRVNIKVDESRANRVQSIPFIFNYYSVSSNKKKLTFWSKLYLRKIYLSHLNETFRKKQYGPALEQANSGKDLFPFISANIKLAIRITQFFHTKR